MVPRPAIAAILAVACVPQLAISQQYNNNDLLPHRRLDIGLINTDEYADAMVTVQASPETPLVGMGEQDHATISRILDTTKEMVGTGRSLIQNKLTLKQGQDMLAQANNLFHEAKNIIQRQQQEQANRATAGGGQDDERELFLRKKYSEHDISQVEENDMRSLDVSRRIFQTVSWIGSFLFMVI